MARTSLRRVTAVGVLSLAIGWIMPIHPAGASMAVGGVKLWTSLYDGVSGHDFAEATAVSPDGSGVFVTGASTGARGVNDYATVAYDEATGAERWARRYDGPGHGLDSAKAIAVSPDGSSVFVTGGSTGAGGDSDYATIAYEAATGSREWVRRYDAPDGGNDFAVDIAVSPDGSLVFVTGTTFSAGGDTDYATVAYDAATGSRDWVRRFGSRTRGDSPQALTVSPDGSRVVVTGASSIHRRHSITYATVSYDALTGDTRWVSRYLGKGRQWVATSVAISPDGSRAFVTGWSNFRGYATVAYDAATGDQEWVVSSLPHMYVDRAVELTPSPDGSRVFVGGSAQARAASSSQDFATMAFDAATGERLWRKLYNDPDDLVDLAEAIGASPDGSQVFVTGTSGSGIEYTTIGYSAATGATAWVRHYDGPEGVAEASDLAVGPDGSRLFVTGFVRSRHHSEDYGTLAYGIS